MFSNFLSMMRVRSVVVTTVVPVALVASMVVSAIVDPKQKVNHI